MSMWSGISGLRINQDGVATGTTSWSFATINAAKCAKRYWSRGTWERIFFDKSRGAAFCVSALLSGSTELHTVTNVGMLLVRGQAAGSINNLALPIPQLHFLHVNK